mmetsp:Transcript_18533/g.60373  ORF Transcript_18533/g.60373 Transcript_18533/m.60373 type:complete len:237 (-) Transcript_18533:73-783(-)
MRYCSARSTVECPARMSRSRSERSMTFLPAPGWNTIAGSWHGSPTSTRREAPDTTGTSAAGSVACAASSRMTVSNHPFPPSASRRSGIPAPADVHTTTRACLTVFFRRSSRSSQGTPSLSVSREARATSECSVRPTRTTSPGFIGTCRDGGSTPRMRGSCGRPIESRRRASSSVAALDGAHRSTRGVGTSRSSAATMPRMVCVLPQPGGPCTSATPPLPGAWPGRSGATAARTAAA